jgi:1-acyl-sn-glycerol-3-phosphate acyltransferase
MKHMIRKIWLHICYKMIMKPFLKIFVGVEFYSQDSFKDVDQFIFVANHNSHMDTMMLLCSVPFRLLGKTHPLAAQDYFGKTPITTWLSKIFVNAALIKRIKGDGENPIQMMVEWLDLGHSLIIFPEGSRGTPDIMQSFKKGISLVLKERPNIPYIPAYLENTSGPLPKGDGLLIPGYSSIRVGRPHYIDNDSSDEENLNQIKKTILSLQQNPES